MLTAAENKQIREVLCAIVVRGVTHEKELEDARTRLTSHFLALKEVAAKPGASTK